MASGAWVRSAASRAVVRSSMSSIAGTSSRVARASSASPAAVITSFQLLLQIGGVAALGGRRPAEDRDRPRGVHVDFAVRPRSTAASRRIQICPAGKEACDERTDQAGGEAAARGGGPRAEALEEVGALPQRAAVGHRPRGLEPADEAWNDFTHDQSRSRAYHWGEDGLAGFSDDRHAAVLLARPVERPDPILKERLFGLTNSEGNHGEDVKEYYFYLDSTPTHAYMKMLYKYPQAAFPYERPGRREPAPRAQRARVRADRHRGVRRGPLLRRVRRVREGRPRGHLHPHHRRQPRAGGGPAARPAAALVPQHLVVGRRTRRGPSCEAGHRDGARSSPRRTPSSATRLLYCDGNPTSCCSPRTRPTATACGVSPNPTPYSKDGINDYLVHGRRSAVNPARTGTKAAAHYPHDGRPGQSADGPAAPDAAAARRARRSVRRRSSAIFAERKQEADEFYAD